MPRGILYTAESTYTYAEFPHFNSKRVPPEYDDIRSLCEFLGEHRNHQSAWVMNRKFAIQLREVKKDGLPLYGENNTIFGHPVLTSPYMPYKRPILFGELSYVWLFERQPMTVQAYLTNDGKYVDFYFTTKIGAALVNEKAIVSEELRKLPEGSIRKISDFDEDEFDEDDDFDEGDE